MSKEAMKLALEALELINLEFVCANGSHHAKKDRHEWDEDCPITDRWRKAITALRDALAEQPAQQKPVIRVNLDMTGAMATLPKTPSESVVEYKPVISDVGTECNIDVEARLFPPKGAGKITLHESKPAQRTWVGLTNDEVNNLAAGCHLGNSVQDAIYKAVAKLKEKNT